LEIGGGGAGRFGSFRLGVGRYGSCRLGVRRYESFRIGGGGMGALG